MRRYVLRDLFLVIYGVKEAKVSVMDARDSAAVNCIFICKEKLPTREGFRKSFQQQSTCFMTSSYASITKFVYKSLYRHVPLVANMVERGTPFPYGLGW
jgi:hypothetical protein